MRGWAGVRRLRRSSLLAAVSASSVLLAFVACSPSPSLTDLQTPPTREAATLTPLQQEFQVHQQAYNEAKGEPYKRTAQGDAWLSRRGVRVVARSGLEIQAHPEGCPPSFPVRGTESGLYFLPSDELYRDRQTGMSSEFFSDQLCFASEQDAVQVGYRRGPHGSR